MSRCLNSASASGYTHVDRPEAGTVASSHVLVEGLDGICTSKLTELLVHVVGAGARVVTEPDAEVLDLQGLLLVDLKGQRRAKETQNAVVSLPFRLPLERLQGTTCDDTNNVNTEDFAAGLLDLVQLTEETSVRRG